MHVLGPYFVQVNKEVSLRADGARAGNASPCLAELEVREWLYFVKQKQEIRLMKDRSKRLQVEIELSATLQTILVNQS